MHLIGNVAEVIQLAVQQEDQDAVQQLHDWGLTKRYTKTDAKTLEGLKKRCRTAGAALRRMEETNKRVAKKAEPLPKDRTDLVKYGQISVISLAGYTGDFQATIYSLITEDVFEKKVSDELRFPVLFVLEEAHNFAPAQARTDAEKRSITTTRQIAQEGRKFGVGLVIISQRPSRLDETTLSQCNSFVIMRMVNPADQTFVKRVIETLGEDEANLLPDLDVGEALLSGQFINFPVLVRMKKPASKGEHEEEDAFKQLEAIHAAQA
jgi:DNA helicase HerA-like ATPase